MFGNTEIMEHKVEIRIIGRAVAVVVLVEKVLVVVVVVLVQTIKVALAAQVLQTVLLILRFRTVAVAEVVVA
jgi:hypothetical protein